MSNETAITHLPLDIDHSCRLLVPEVGARAGMSYRVSAPVTTEKVCPACCYIRGWKDGREWKDVP